MARYERNKEYLDQIYYAIGNLYLSRKDTTEAKKNYITAVEKSTRNGIDKAPPRLPSAEYTSMKENMRKHSHAIRKPYL